MDAAAEYFELVDGERFDELIALFGPDAELIGPGTAPRRGADEIRDYYERAFAPYVDHSDRPTRTIRAGSTVVVEIRFRGELKNGAELEFDAVDVFDLAGDGRISRLSSWYDSHRVRTLLERAHSEP
jgi:ketosteroid isomerase-like protein